MKNSNYKNKNIEKKYSCTWYDWLINYNPEHIIKITGGFKDKIVRLLHTNTPKNLVQDRIEIKKIKNTKAIWRNQNYKSFYIKKEKSEKKNYRQNN